MKRYLTTLAILIAVPIGYWLVSPLFIERRASEKIEDISVKENVSTISEGKFEGLGLHNATGTAKLVKIGDKFYIRFEENFQVTNGPDLFVHFGKDGKYAAEAQLGALKGNIGGQNYEVPAGINSEEFNEIWIWCRAFSVPFAKAIFNKQAISPPITKEEKQNESGEQKLPVQSLQNLSPKGGATTISKTSNGDKLPVLKNLGIKIESWDKTTNMAGDFLFENKNYVDNKIFTEFAHKIVNNMGEKLLPEIGFNVPVGTKIVSPIDGIITDVKLYEPSQDYIIFMGIDASSPWIIGFEHIYNVRVNIGDRVLAGQELAEVSPSYGKTEFGNVEINVWTAGQNIIKYCPFDFLDESLKSIYTKKLNQLANDWEEFIGKNVYQQEVWISPGCLMDKIIEG